MTVALNKNKVHHDVLIFSNDKIDDEITNIENSQDYNNKNRWHLNSISRFHTAIFMFAGSSAHLYKS